MGGSQRRHRPRHKIARRIRRLEGRSHRRVKEVCRGRWTAAIRAVSFLLTPPGDGGFARMWLPASSIRERIYTIPDVGYGVLLYTGTSDAEGTLGGLIQVARRIHEHIRNALEMGELCSNDPVCAQHEPANLHERRFLHGAACHGCLLISETSCEQHNEFLDRSLVVPTVDNLGVEFFKLTSK